jgi:hypothetical protein
VVRKFTGEQSNLAPSTVASAHFWLIGPDDRASLHRRRRPKPMPMEEKATTSLGKASGTAVIPRQEISSVKKFRGFACVQIGSPSSSRCRQACRQGMTGRNELAGSWPVEPVLTKKGERL